VAVMWITGLVVGCASSVGIGRVTT